MTQRFLNWPVFLVAVGLVALGASYAGGKVGRQYEHNKMCCRTPQWPNIRLSLREVLGLTRFPSQIGQDKWVLYTVFPGVTDGFFLDVGSADGTELPTPRRSSSAGGGASASTRFRPTWRGARAGC